MAIFRIEKTRDYCVMSNYHLKDRSLSLMAKGLLSVMLSLPEGQEHSTRSLAASRKESVDTIAAAMQELERAGYIVRSQGEGGEYTVYERPAAASVQGTKG